MKTFKYKKYKRCYFDVSSYISNPDALAIIMNSEVDGPITDVTVNLEGWFYGPCTATIKNYSENAGMTKFLQDLGIIDTIYSSTKCNEYAEDSETIDFCLLNMEKLKEYSNSIYIA